MAKRGILDSQWLLLVVGGLLIMGLAVVDCLECYACDSAEDVECATRPGQQLEVEECSLAGDECVTSISAGLTRRGCLARLYPNGYCAAPCDRCNTSLCNRHVYPTDRLRCYQCSGSECIDVTSRPQYLLPCPVYREDDRCYTNVVHLSNTQRGCEYTNLPTTCPHVCLKCNYNGCNAEKTVTETRCLQCVHNRLAPNPDCLRDQEPEDRVPEDQPKCSLSNTTVSHCANKVMYGHRENCYSYRNTQTEVFQRGCSTTMGFFPTGELSECHGEFCNANCQDIVCAVCNSTANPGCRAGRNLPTEKCAAGTTACYSCEQDTFLRRGCADADFAPAALGDSCQLCRDADSCNRYSVRSCYRCNAQDADTDCAAMDLPPAMTISNCTSSTELCVSTVVSRLDGIYTVRGCESQVPECSANDPYCVRCNGSLCNDAPTLWRQTQLDLVANQDLRDSWWSLLQYWWSRKLR
ncbi:uncharacterized protein LOC108149877 isoform X1 [Drosophila elegans]|uniref:uncharacterized protein LOC108149877 isoform X1 n=1 Tax=Drosophila elegans TaxID=30023 RepID=UPI001BC84164|nr:uncharacterized protein LOC108149877 isoform X1 [Drosophila elegans]